MGSDRHKLSPLSLAAALAVCLALPAHADRIDGDWCDGARSISISGPSVRTPGGNTISGQYGRHDFHYAIPAGEPAAGAAVDMRLLNEDNVEVSYATEDPKVWRRCKVTS